MTKRTNLVAAVAALLLAAAHTVAADESGSFFMIRSYQNSYITLEHSGESYTGGFLRGTQTILESSGGPFTDGMNSSSECLVFSRSSDDGIDLEAPCVNTDLDGDLLYTTAIRNQGTIGDGGGGAGRWELRGGTGKYEGVTGKCTYQTQYLDGNQVVVIGDCTWSTP